MVKVLFLIIIYLLIKLKAKDINKDSNLIIKKKDNINSNYKKKNLILGTIVNYDWKTISPFFISFKKAGFNNCDCIMFANKIEQKIINKIKSFDVKIIQKQRILNVRINNYRYKLYEDFLRNNSDKYHLVLIIDVRDSIFQKDIFKYYENNKSILVLSLEDENLSTIINKSWFIDAFGVNIHKTIENERIICSGTILGSSDKILEFSSMIWKVLKINNYSRKRWHDQSAVNYLIYYKKLFHNDFIVRNENKNGLILTLATANPKNFMIDSEDNILNGNGEIAAVIHQYNRYNNITSKILNKYSSDSIKENEYNNYNKIEFSKSFLKKSQLFKDHIYLSLTKKNTNKNVKIQQYILILFILLILLKIKFSSFIHFQKNQGIKIK